MRLLGDNGAGYELAQRLEENAVWRAWLGEREYILLQPYLLTPGTWSAFMQNENPSVIALQLRVRALLFDKALVSLNVESAAASPPSALDASFLQLHADSVYFTLEHEVEDWARLQAEKSPTVASLLLKHGLDSSVSITRSGKLNDAESGISSRPIKAPQLGQSVSSALISPRQLASRTHAKAGFGISGNTLDPRTLGELWYTQCMQRDLMNRMNRLARRTAQRSLPFGEQEACLRTPMEMADYVSSQANHRKRRPVFRLDADSKQSERSVYGGGDDGGVFMPEFQYLANCVPDNAISAGPSPSRDGLDAHGAFLDKLNHLRDLSSGNLLVRGKDRPGVSFHRSKKLAGGRGHSQEVAQRSRVSDEIATKLAEQVAARLVAAAGYEGLTQSALKVLGEILGWHVQTLGSRLRRIVDTCKTECSPAELLKMCLTDASGSKLEDLKEYYDKSVQRRRQAPVQMPQQTNQQAQIVQEQINPHPASRPVMIPYQAQQLHPGYPKRRQSSSPGGFNRLANGGELAIDSSSGGLSQVLNQPLSTGLSQVLNQPLSTGFSQVLNQPLSQGHVSWSPQAPIHAGLSQIQQPPPMLQHFKQQLSSLQIPSLQHNLSGALKLPSPRLPGMADILASDSIKHELVDQGEGSQFPLSTQGRKQNQRSWGYSE